MAMQLTNIARDVGEDARNGRLYLPQAWLREAGIAPASWLRNPVFTPAIGRVVQRLLAAAEALYQRADSGITGLPWDCRPGIAAARTLYSEIGAQVARNGYDSISRRAVVSSRRKALLLSRAVLGGVLPGQAGSSLTLPACRYLVQAAAVRAVVRPSFDDRVGWTLALFARLNAEQAVIRR